MKNIVLTGLPGCGKSTLGKELGQRLERPFLDLDAQIARKAGKTIPKIFEEDGEGAFRDLESRMILEVSQLDGTVIATGGGAVLRKENRERLRQNGWVLWIDCPVQQIAQDIDRSGRPLLQAGTNRLLELEQERRELYRESAHQVVVNDKSKEETLAALCCCAAPQVIKGDFVVLGDPIGHSRSPLIHEAAFRARGETCRYETYHVPRGMLGLAVESLRTSSVQGWNVTLPHKQEMIGYLDEAAREVQLCGAVNTVVKREGKLLGYNTDMEGLNLSLKRAGHGFNGRKVLVLGAGGAACAVAMKAAVEGAESLCIAARDPRKSEELARRVSEAGMVTAQFGDMSASGLAQSAKHSDLLINCTPLGMEGMPGDFEKLDFLDALPTGGMVCDLIYTPAKTTLLKAAESRGYDTLNGLGMLIYQALLAQELFLNQQLDKEPMYTAVLEAMNTQKGENLP